VTIITKVVNMHVARSVYAYTTLRNHANCNFMLQTVFRLFQETKMNHYNVHWCSRMRTELTILLVC